MLFLNLQVVQSPSWTELRGLLEERGGAQPDLRTLPRRQRQTAGVCRQKGLQKAHCMAKAIPKRLLISDNPHQGGWHVQNGNQYVAKGQVHGENTGHLSANLAAVDEA